MRFVHEFSLTISTHGYLLWPYMLMTSTSSAHMMPYPRLFLNSKVILRWKILEKPPLVLVCKLNILQHAFSYIIVCTLERCSNNSSWMGSPTKFTDGCTIIGPNKHEFWPCDEGDKCLALETPYLGTIGTFMDLDFGKMWSILSILMT